MNKVALLLAGVTGFLTQLAFAAEALRGSVLELHSCELYAGGCVVSSEAPQGGRYMLRVWSFSGGNSEGVNLAGLQASLLQVSPDNLATPDGAPGKGVVYLPEAATTEQRNALMHWVSKASAVPAGSSLQTRIVPMRLTKDGDGYQFTAGNFVRVRTESLESCPTGACGEALWYTPRTEDTIFTVAANRSSSVAEPLLELKWQDAGKKSVFLARFGEQTTARNLYVSAADLCGPGGKLF